MKRLLVAISFVALAVLALPIRTAIADDSHQTYELQQAYFDQQQEYVWSNQLVTYSQTLVGKRTGQCVMALRNYFGVPYADVHGAARNTKINLAVPKIGAVIVLKMSSVGHVGIVIAQSGDTITYFDSNGSWTQRGAIRYINKNSNKIKGYRLINYK